MKSIVTLVILIIIAIVGWLWYGSSNTATDVPATTTESQTYVPADAGLNTSAADSSDAALQNDLDSINTQLNSLNSDTTAIDQSLNNL